MHASADFRGSHPCQTGQPLAHPILKEQVVGHRQFVVGRQSGLEGQHAQIAQVLLPEHGVGDSPPGSDRVCSGIDERGILEVFVGALFDGVDAQDG